MSTVRSGTGIPASSRLRGGHGTSRTRARTLPLLATAGTWVAKQRDAYRAGTLNTERILTAKVYRSGLGRTVTNEVHAYALLDRYADEHGTSRPTSLQHRRHRDRIVGSSQQEPIRQGKLPADRQQRLEELPEWTWDLSGDVWDERFALLERFAARRELSSSAETCRGRCELGQWVGVQRTNYRRSSRPPTAPNAYVPLDGWVWDTRARAG